MYNNQHDALFILSLLNYHTSTCFGRINSTSSGGRMYICGKWCLLYCTADRQPTWVEFHPDTLTVDLEVLQAPYAKYIHSTS
jgi:hypothetical protein